MLTNEDYAQSQNRGISKERLLEQLGRFEKGFPYPEVIAPANEDRGITFLSKERQFGYVKRYSSHNGKIIKFVPASGAASRMFRELYEALDISDKSKGFVPENHVAKKMFIDQIEKYAFFDQLKEFVDIFSSSHSQILRALLTEEGMSYGNMPKGLIKFHRYNDEVRTPLEEHLFGASKYAQGVNGECNLVFTVSPEHLKMFRRVASELSVKMGNKSRATFNIDFTLQKESTDTIAVDLKNQPLRDSNGSLVFRPGGHGALIENLNECDADIFIIKNIDNVSREELTIDTVWWKKVLLGMMLDVRDNIYNYLKLLDGEYDSGLIEEIKVFIKDVLCVDMPKIPSELEKEYIKARLDRPLRVCGMVKNLGEPGGGPFLVKEDDGAVSLQILESAQLDTSDANIVSILESATHFNPVDIVCSVVNYKGEKYYLPDFIDKETGFISQKSSEGKSLKALELPGLWNGAMSKWNTIFVDVPITTFTPVKTVFDLLRPEHQG
jgi:hypothetical protein